MHSTQSTDHWVIDHLAAAARHDLHVACHAALSVVPDGSAFSHVTAARLLDLPISYAMADDDRLHVLRPITKNRVRISGFVGHRALHPRAVVMVGGLPVVGLADTWTDLGELVGRGKPVGLDDLVVLGDACATRLGSRQPLLTSVLSRVRPRGKRTLLEAYGEIRVGSASARESVARLVLSRGGLPEPKLNEPIFASWDPDLLLGVGDLVWELVDPNGQPVKVVGEYQGRLFHSGIARRRRDKRRATGLRDDGWKVEEIWNDDLNGAGARRTTLIRFAKLLHVDIGDLNLARVEPRFFSSHAMDLAIQRQMQGRSRALRLG
ncbi:hypothetical protein ACWEOW_09160 [Monashia sp. NPDC004114]